MEKTSLIFLTISFILNLLLLSLVLMLWFIRCHHCSKDKEFRQIFKKLCEKCGKNGKEKKTNGKKETPIY